MGSIGHKIKLRALEPEDLDVLYKWENDREIWKVSNTLIPFSRYVLQKYIENSHLDIYQTKQLRLMVDWVNTSNNNAATVGSVDLFDFDPFHHRAGIGILIGEKNDRNKGIATNALKKVIEYAFNGLLLHQLYCNISVENSTSIKVFEKVGFTVSGTKKEWLKVQNGYCDELILQLINS